MNILVTGISKGLGLATAERLLEQGYSVFGISRSRTEPLEALQKKYPGRLQWIGFDLTLVESLKESIFREWIGPQTPLHGLVNNAAVAYDDLITNLEVETLEKMFRLNVTTPMVLTKYAVRHMLLHQTGGSVVHVSSICAHSGYKGLALYGATKGALEAFSKNCAREWGERGIRSNCVVPGFMETEMSSGLSEEQKQRIFQRNCLKKPVSLSAAAETICFLISEGARSITGQNIFVDNGTI